MASEGLFVRMGLSDFLKAERKTHAPEREHAGFRRAPIRLFGGALGACVAIFVAAAPAAAAGAPHPGVHILHKFSGGKGGGNPFGPLLSDAAGNLFGTTQLGGSAGFGVAFSLSHASQGAWPEKVLHAFGGADGTYPEGGLIFDGQGNLYGSTFSGTGSASGGVVFELTPKGQKWSYAVLNGFGGGDSAGGSNPNGGLVFDGQGNLFGTAQLGGSVTCPGTPGPCGVVYELSPGKSGGWTETVLYSFGGVPDGAYPYSPVLFDQAGNLYGTTSEGGNGKCMDGEGNTIGCGTIFELSNSGGTWSETILYNFTNKEQNMPGSPLVFDTHGALYSTAGYDVFRLKQSNGQWKKTTVFEFTEGLQGTLPSSGVVFDQTGNLYGTTASSGLEGYSTAFELSPPSGGRGAWTLATLARFGKGLDSNQPRGGILIGNNGTLYGATSNSAGRGYVFSIAR